MRTTPIFFTLPPTPTLPLVLPTAAVLTLTCSVFEPKLSRTLSQNRRKVPLKQRKAATINAHQREAANARGKSSEKQWKSRTVGVVLCV